MKIHKLIFCFALTFLTMPTAAVAGNLAEINQELRWAATIDDAESINKLLDAGASRSEERRVGKEC